MWWTRPLPLTCPDVLSHCLVVARLPAPRYRLKSKINLGIRQCKDPVPELPDIVTYIEALDKRIQGETLERIRIASPFLLRTATPPLISLSGRRVISLRRLGKRICFGFPDDLWLVLHLMIA